jgi:hypothetical protein
VWGKGQADKDSMCKLLICKVLRPDYFMIFAHEFIRDNLGEEFVPEGMPAIEKVFKS